VVLTKNDVIQFGIPPETIKDTLQMECGVPKILVIGEQFFSYSRGLMLADVEFPIFFNFFIKQQRCTIVCTEEQKLRVKQFMQESMFGPQTIDLDADVQGDHTKKPWCPDLEKEMSYFGRNPFKPGQPLCYDDFVEFKTFTGEEEIAHLENLSIRRTADQQFEILDHLAKKSVLVPRSVSLPPCAIEPVYRKTNFQRPTFGVSIVGRGHGFDPNTKTTGFILWSNGRGILVDPPVDCTEYLKENEIPSRTADTIILTHCHADHCAGTLQKALQADRIKLYTTPTIYASFLRKAEAITGLSAEIFEQIIDYRPVPIRKPIFIHGARFSFHYTLHSIPCIGLEAWLGGKSLAYSSDTLNDPAIVEQMHLGGLMSRERADDLIEFPWHHDLVIHEAGVPPIHTSTSFLDSLSEDIKSRLYIVHTTQSAIPEGSNLRLAPLGLENSLELAAAKPALRDAVEWVRAMRAVDHFQGMSSEKVEEFLELVQHRRVSAGEPLIKTGEIGDEFFMILDGKCAIYHGEVQRKVFGMYDYFGETALVGSGRRTADVTAISDMELLVMKGSAFLDFLRGTKVIETMRRLYENRDLGTWKLLDLHPIFRDLNATQRTRLQAIIEPVKTDAGESLDPNQGVYLLREGSVDYNDQICETPGALIGDLEAIARQTTSNFKVRARSAVSTFHIPKDAFREYLLAYPGLFLRLVHND
jgi:CRP-like cAMP-binding protein